MVFSKNLQDAIFTAFFNKRLKEHFCFHDDLFFPKKRKNYLLAYQLPSLLFLGGFELVLLFVSLSVIRDQQQYIQESLGLNSDSPEISLASLSSSPLLDSINLDKYVNYLFSFRQTCSFPHILKSFLLDICCDFPTS